MVSEFLHKHEAHNVPINENGDTAQPHYLIVSAKTAAGVMMSVSLRGYTVWLINIVLCIYFFTQTFKISDYNRIKAAITSPMFVTPEGTMRKKVIPQNGPYAEKYTLIARIFVCCWFLIKIHRIYQYRLFSEMIRNGSTHFTIAVIK